MLRALQPATVKCQPDDHHHNESAADADESQYHRFDEATCDDCHQASVLDTATRRHRNHPKHLLRSVQRAGLTGRNLPRPQ